MPLLRLCYQISASLRYRRKRRDISKVMNTLIAKDYLTTLKYFITASYKTIYFLVNIANIRDACIRETTNFLIAALSRDVTVTGIVNLKQKQSIQSFNSKQFGNILSQHGAQIYNPKPNVCMHAKAFLFDKKNLILGSHNLTASANSKNIELSIMITDPDTISRFLDIFKNFSERCTQK